MTSSMLGVCLAVLAGVVVSTVALNSGPYTVLTENVQDCATKSTSESHYQIIKINGERRMHSQSTITQDYSQLTGRLTTSCKRNGGWKKDGMSLNILGLCNNPIVKDIMEYTNITFTSDCTLKKGYYELNNLDLNEITHKFLGSISGRGYFRHEFAIISQGEQVLCVVIDTHNKAL